MTGRNLLAIFLLTAVALSGCAKQEGSSWAMEEAIAEQETEAPDVGTTDDDPDAWLSDDANITEAFAMPVHGSAGFGGEIPADRAVGSSSGSSFRYHHIYLEPRFTRGAGNMAAALFIDGGLVAIHQWGDGRSWDLDAGSTSPLMDHGSRLLQLAESGQERWQILVGSDRPGYLKLYFGDTYDSFGTSTIPDDQTFLRLEANGTGQAFEAHTHIEYISVIDAAFGTSSIEQFGSPDVSHSDLMTMSGGVLDASYAATCDLGGAAIASTFWYALVEDTVLWEHSVQAGSQQTGGLGIHSSVVLYDTVVTEVTFGLPVGSALGTGNATATLQLTGQAAPLFMDTHISVICFDKSADALLGSPVPGFAWREEGLA